MHVLYMLLYGTRLPALGNPTSSRQAKICSDEHAGEERIVSYPRTPSLGGNDHEGRQRLQLNESFGGIDDHYFEDSSPDAEYALGRLNYKIQRRTGRKKAF